MWSKEVKRKYREAYSSHKYQAINTRGVGFELTMDQWIEIWLESGHMQERGTKKGQYVMARNGDVGPYAVGNVRIILSSDNVKEMFGNPGGQILRAKRKIFAIGNQNKKGKKEGPETRAKKSASHKGLRPSNETRIKLAASNDRKWAEGGVLWARQKSGNNKHSEEAKIKMRISALRLWEERRQKKENEKNQLRARCEL